MKKIAVIHGPNLNFLGIRERNVYGNLTLTEVNALITQEAQRLGIETIIFQSNHEGALIDFIQKCCFDSIDGFIINPGAFTHYSYALRDALTGAVGASGEPLPCIEVHISNIHKREEFRHQSVIAPACLGQICGLGVQSYLLALTALDKVIK